jgi:hypothetical protein
MKNHFRFAALSVAVLSFFATRAQAQRPYIGFVYPAGGQQGTTFIVRIGGQGYENITGAVVSGAGVTVKLHDYFRAVNNQEEALLGQQARELRKMKPLDSTRSNMLVQIEKRIYNRIQTPACRSIATLAMFEITIAPDAPPGEREIRIINTRGTSNPLAFHIGQTPEYTRKPMRTSLLQTLGKEAQSLRKRPPEEIEDRINIPCTVNGQIASGEINRYRFTARKGQRLVLTTLARQLVPYIADAVPGWFQPVLVLYDKNGKEVAYDDDYRFKPDPTILYEAPEDGEYTFAIYDSIYRGREDFVYRITVGELPFVTSIFPLGARTGDKPDVKMTGWNLDGAELALPDTNAGRGVYQVVAKRNGIASNPMPFALDTLPECLEQESNDTPSRAQKVTLPIIINGRINKPDDIDVYQFQGKAGETVVAEVMARRLDSPLDSILKLTNEKGELIALNDDCEDLATGMNTHHADSYFRVKLPADGTYHLTIADTARHGGDEFGYRLRISAPRPDFALRIVPSNFNVRSKGFISPNIYLLRKDGYTGPIKLSLKNPPEGFTAPPISLTRTQTLTQTSLSIKTDKLTTQDPVNLVIEGSAKDGNTEFTTEAVPAEDRMQAFLWRHLVPAKNYAAYIYDPTYELPPKHPVPYRPPHTNIVASATVAATTGILPSAATNAAAAFKGKFTKAQVANRVREIKRLYEDGLLTDEFYNKKMDECEAAE